ncbi:MAG: SDR family oxidoreductase [Dechloromonas sp.]|nr:SDR family oxidoreductase [Dechloromonas sp.]
MSDIDPSRHTDYRQLFSLNRRAHVVLGAGQGIGLATCHALSQAGARVLCVDRDPALAEAAAQAVGGVAFSADVTDAAGVASVFARASEAFGRVDGVVDIVGMAIIRKIEEFSDEDWDRQFDVVLRHAFFVVREAARRFADGGGALTFVGSVSGMRAVRNQTGYGTAKAALHHLVRTSAAELGPKGIRVNGIAPAYVRTPRLLEAFSAEFWDGVKKWVPMGRTGVPADIAAAALFLQSDLARYVTGNILTLDGGGSNVAALPGALSD